VNRSYIKTRNLEDLAARDPAMAEQVEALCRAVLALRGFALIMQAESVLAYAARATGPFIEATEVSDEIARLKGAARLPPELRPEEVAEYKRLARSSRADKALKKILERRELAGAR
jgi:hypothetical protein